MDVFVFFFIQTYAALSKPSESKFRLCVEARLMRHRPCCHKWGSNTCLTFWVMKKLSVFSRMKEKKKHDKGRETSSWNSCKWSAMRVRLCMALSNIFRKKLKNYWCEMKYLFTWLLRAITCLLRWSLNLFVSYDNWYGINKVATSESYIWFYSSYKSYIYN